MKNDPIRWLYLTVWAAILLTLPACGGLLSTIPVGPTPIEPEPDSPEIAAILDRLASRNPHVHSLKGLARIKLWDSRQAQHARTAWTISRPDKIRILLMGITGFPVASLASDGEWVTLMSHTENRFYRDRNPDADLERVLNLRVHTRDVIQIVSGGLPIRHHAASRLEDMENGRTSLLVLLAQTGFPVQRVLLDDTLNTVIHSEFYDESGDLEYRVGFENWAVVEESPLPFRITLENGKENGLILDMERFWINPAVSGDMFVLSPP